MLSYETALKLKEAGFPKEDILESYDGVYHRFPTLSELIESCVDGVNRLTIDWSPITKKWGVAMFYPPVKCKHHSTCQCKGHGNFKRAEWYETPEEAVANLWLELNKK